MINYALTGKSVARAIASFHGGLSRLAPLGGKIQVKIMIASGGEDDAASDIEDLEMAMKEGQAPAWEYTRYQGVVSYSAWGVFILLRAQCISCHRSDSSCMIFCNISFPFASDACRICRCTPSPNGRARIATTFMPMFVVGRRWKDFSASPLARKDPKSSKRTCQLACPP